MIFQELLAFLEKDKIDFLVVKPIGNHTGPAVTGIGMIGQFLLVQWPGGGIGNTVLIDIGIDPVGGRAADRAKEPVEPTMNGPVGNGAGKVRLFDALDLSIGDELSLLVEEGHADVPLANAGGGISLVAEHLGEGEPVFLDQAGSLHPREYALHPRAECHPPSEQAVPGGSAHGGWAVGIGKVHSLLRHLVQMGGRDFRLWIVATQVSITQIIGENEQDVWLG